MTIRINTRYRVSGDNKLLKFGYQVSDTLNNNPLFLNAQDKQAALHAACDEFRIAGSLAGRRDLARLSAKNDKKLALINLLDEMAAYVTETCKGDKTMLLSSGFEITGIRSKSVELTPITEIKVQSEFSGHATIRLKRVTGAKTYVYQYTTTDPQLPETVWLSEASLNKEHTITNLKSVTRYWFRVMAIGKGDRAVYSPLVARVIH